MVEHSQWGRQKVYMVTTVEDDPICCGLFATREVAEQYVAASKLEGTHETFEIDDYEIYTNAQEAL